MKDRKFICGPTSGVREDGAPVDYARYGPQVRDRLAETDIMLALIVDKDDKQQQRFDPYNTAGA